MNPHLETRSIDYGSKEYEEALALRKRVLRDPLGLKFTLSELERDHGDQHFIATLDGRVAGCLSLSKTNIPTTLQMRQVAVDTQLQNMKIGKRLVEFSEDWALQNGVNRLILHARDLAVPFYERLGYDIEGDAFIEVGIIHFNMLKMLS